MNIHKENLEKAITKSLQEVLTLRDKLEKLETAKKDQQKDWVLSIIGILDSFERVEQGLSEKGIQDIEEGGKIMKRYASIQKKMLYLLEKHGVTRIELAENVLVMGLCEVVDTEPDATKNTDEIISIERNGYILGGEVIRAAQVIIVKN
jgi:molecular chaperone GrpE (heat shock protein)